MYEKILIDDMITHRLHLEDDDVDELSDSEIADSLGNKEINHLAKEVFDRYLEIVSKIYSLPFTSQPK